MNTNDAKELWKKTCDEVHTCLTLEGMTSQPPKNSEEILKRSITSFEKLLRKYHDWNILFILGKCHQALNNQEKAYESFLEAHRKNPTEINVLKELGLTCLTLGKYDAATYYAQTSIAFNPNDPELWANISVSLLLQKKKDKAIEWAKKCLTKLPGDCPAMMVILCASLEEEPEILLGYEKLKKKHFRNILPGVPSVPTEEINIEETHKLETFYEVVYENEKIVQLSKLRNKIEKSQNFTLCDFCERCVYWPSGELKELVIVNHIGEVTVVKYPRTSEIKTND